MSKDKVQEKQNIHTVGCESLLDFCNNDIFVHSYQPRKAAEGLGDHAKQRESEGPPHLYPLKSELEE